MTDNIVPFELKRKIPFIATPAPPSEDFILCDIDDVIRLSASGDESSAMFLLQGLLMNLADCDRSRLIEVIEALDGHPLIMQKRAELQVDW